MTLPPAGWPLIILAALLAVSGGCSSDAAGKADQNRLFLFFPQPPATPRVQFVTTFNDSSVVAQERSALEVFAVGEDTTPPEEIGKPYGVAARDGVVYVCDTKGFSITRIDFKNRTFSRIGTGGPGRLAKPLNIVIDPLGFKFVVDSSRKQVVVFDPEDKFVKAFDVPPPCFPVDVAVWGNEIFVLSGRKESHIVVLDRTSGKVLRTFGKRGALPGEFNFPSSLCVDRGGSVYVSDTIMNRIQKLTPDGKPVWTRGEPGRHLQQFARPKGIRAGPDDILFVVESAMELVKMYDTEGRLLMFFGGPGGTPGALELPAAVAVDTTSIPYFKQFLHKDFTPKYLLFVTSQYGPRAVSVYAFGSFPEGYELSESELTTLPSLPTPGSTQPAPGPARGPADVKTPEGGAGQEEKGPKDEPKGE